MTDILAAAVTLCAIAGGGAILAGYPHDNRGVLAAVTIAAFYTLWVTAQGITYVWQEVI